MPRILMVEDHGAFSGALQALLGRRLLGEDGGPPEVFRAETVAEGVRIADREGPFDLAVVDLILPDGDGEQVVRAVRAFDPETPVAVLSAARDLSGALAAGADITIDKGTPLREIVSRLARLASGENQTAG